MNDFDLWCEGLKDQKDTWWGKKILKNEELVRSGALGEVLKEWKKSSGWGDGVQISYFVLQDDIGVFICYANESGVFKKLASGGSVNISMNLATA